MSELEALGSGEPPPPYMIFVVVFLFFLTGLLGFLICHLLKKKGYRCRTGDMDDEEEEEKLGGNADDEDEENQDTVEQILKCIIENEANMEAFNEMIGNHNVCVRHDPRLRKESIGGIPPHHHTVHSGTDHNSCHLCAQVRSKKGRRHSRTPRSKLRPGEQTVFSVGRFRVTHTDKKLHGGPNPLVSSGDQLDQSQDSEERKEGGYNLRSMFKDAPNVGKRRRSVTLFGLRRGSDPVGIKAGEGTDRETGGVRFAIQQQPVVLEELLQPENTEVTPERGTKPETEPTKNQTPASPQDKTSNSVNSPSSQSKNQAHDSSSAPDDGAKHGTSSEPRAKLGSTAPSSLPIPSAPSEQTFKTKEKLRDAEDKMLKNDDPGPLQTSTPIVPMHGSIPGFTPVIPTGQTEPSPSTGFPVTQTPPDPSSSPDLEPGFDALISLGSSPPSSFPFKTPSTLSSLKTPTSPLAITPSPKLSSRNTTSEAAKTALTPSPKLPSGRGMSPSPVSPQTPSSPADQNPIGRSPQQKSENVTSRSPLSLKEQELERAKIPKTEIKRAGILKTSKLSPAEGSSKGSPSLPLLPSSPLSPSSPVGTISNVAIVKASPDSKREFSVVTMVDEESSTLIKDRKGETSELGVDKGISPAGDQGAEVSVSDVRQPQSQSGETPEAEIRPTVSQEKDDMVEMEDIRDCKVTQVEETGRMEE